MRAEEITTAHDALTWLALKRVSEGTVAACWPLVAAICVELDVASPPKQLLGGKIIAALVSDLNRLVNNNRALALSAIIDDPFAELQQCQIIAAVGELLAVPYEGLDAPYEDHGGMFDYLRRRVRGVTDKEWREIEDVNHQPKQRWQVRAAVWLRQVKDGRKYSYRGVQDNENDYLEQFLAAFRVYIRQGRSALHKTLQAKSEVEPASESAAVTVPEPDTVPDYSAPEIVPESLPPVSQAVPSWYTRRPALERQVIDLIEQGHKAIALTGLPGMGKSSLAEAVAHTLNTSESDVAWVSMRDGHLSLPDLSAVASSTAVSRSMSPAAEPPELLAAILNSPQAPRILVLDNLNDTDELHRLVPRVKSSIVIATCRYKGKIHPRPWQVLEIERMKDIEILALIRSNLPGLPNVDNTRLARLVHGYPLVASYAVRLISQCGMSVERFCEDMADDSATLLGDVEAGDGERLEAILRRMVNACKERDALSYELLVLVALARNGLSLGFLVESLEDIGAPSASHCARAVKVLRDFGIVTSRAHMPGHLECHPLTRDVLEKFFADHIPDTALNCLRALYRSFKREKEKHSVNNDESQSLAFLLYTLGVLDSYHNAVQRGIVTQDLGLKRDQLLRYAHAIGHDALNREREILLSEHAPSNQPESVDFSDPVWRDFLDNPEGRYDQTNLLERVSRITYFDEVMARLPPREYIAALLAELQLDSSDENRAAAE